MKAEKNDDFQREEKEIFKDKEFRGKLMIDSEWRQPAPSYERILGGLFTVRQLPKTQRKPQRSQARLPAVSTQRDIRKIYFSSLNKYQGYDDGVNEKSYVNLQPLLVHPQKRRKRKRNKTAIKTEQSRVNFSDWAETPTSAVEMQLHSTLISVQSKQIVLRLQKLHPLLRRMSFIAVQEIVGVCRLVKFKRKQVIYTRKTINNIYTFLVISGTASLKCRKWGVRVAATEGDIFEEDIAVPLRYSQHDDRFDIGRCMSEETVCLKISRAQWLMVSHKLKTVYNLLEDIKLFEGGLRKSFLSHMNQLTKEIYQLTT